MNYLSKKVRPALAKKDNNCKICTRPFMIGDNVYIMTSKIDSTEFNVICESCGKEVEDIQSKVKTRLMLLIDKLQEMVLSKDYKDLETTVIALKREVNATN